MLFIGGFEHSPNIDAAIRLVRGVMPRVWSELGDVPVTIVGGSTPPEVADWPRRRVEVAGWVPDVGPLFDAARAMVAPLSYGAGLKGKVTQSLADGLPVVTTPIGAEGLNAVDGEQLLIGADDQRAGRPGDPGPHRRRPVGLALERRPAAGRRALVAGVDDRRAQRAPGRARAGRVQQSGVSTVSPRGVPIHRRLRSAAVAAVAGRAAAPSATAG